MLLKLLLYVLRFSIVALDFLVYKLLETDAAVAPFTAVTRLNHHSNAHVRLNKTLEIRRIQNISYAGNHFVVLLVKFEDALLSLNVGLAKYFHSKRNVVDVVVEVLLDLFEAKRYNLLT